MRRLFALGLTATLLSVSLSRASEQEEGALRGPIRGITISTHRGGGDWASDGIVVAFQEVQRIGANWVAIHPYGRIAADGSVTTRFSLEAPSEHVLRPIREARALGLKILIKPHLAYWGSPFGWRSEIDFGEDEEKWERFWRDYETFLLALASWTVEADAFVVGTELRGTLSQDARWRHLIARVRRVTDVPLTYAANWDDYKDVRFWDALDAVGIQAYFPLTDAADRSEAAQRRGWGRWMTELAGYASEWRRPVVFTELGYNQSEDAPVRPWEYRTDLTESARSLQELTMRIALEAVDAEPSVLGVFLWKWFLPPRRVGRNFQLATPSMERVIRGRWAQ